MKRFACVLTALCLLAARPAPAADDDVSSELNNRYGYLALDTMVERPVTNWRLSRSLAIDKVPEGRQLRLIRMRIGKYQWTEINVPYFNLPHRMDLSDDTRWAFEIHPRKINYAGTLVVGEQRSSDSVEVRFLNRTTEVLELLREKFPAQAEVFEVVYSGAARDDFLEFMREPDAGASQ